MISKKCIKCNREMIRIVYGYPAPEFENISKDLGMAMGGCQPGPITHFCKICKISWSSDMGFDNYN